MADWLPHNIHLVILETVVCDIWLSYWFTYDRLIHSNRSFIPVVVRLVSSRRTQSFIVLRIGYRTVSVDGRVVETVTRTITVHNTYLTTVRSICTVMSVMVWQRPKVIVIGRSLLRYPIGEKHVAGTRSPYLERAIHTLSRLFTMPTVEINY